MIPETLKSNTQYKIIREITEGGMGVVYEAMQVGAEGFHKRVALKTILDSHVNDKRYVDMFLAEARLVSNLVHENIVQIYQLERASFGYFIVMEYVRGISLDDLIDELNRRNKLLPVELAVFIVSRIARGMQYAHTRKDDQGEGLEIVHRDVCPSNVMVTSEGLPKLTDFGIAKAHHMDIPSYDQCLMGKLHYIAPEQARKHITDFRTDIYSLGIILFELLCGEVPRHASDDSELLDLACAGAVNIDKLPKDLSPELLQILYKAIQVEPGDRFDSAEAMGRALEFIIYRNGYGPTTNSLEEFLRFENIEFS